MLAPGEPSPRGHARALLRAHLARLAYEPKRHPKGSADVVGGPERDGGKFAPAGQRSSPYHPDRVAVGSNQSLDAYNTAATDAEATATDAQRAAANAYTGGGYRRLNEMLREGEDLEGTPYAAMRDGLDGLMRPLPSPVTVVRGVSVQLPPGTKLGDAMDVLGGTLREKFPVGATVDLGAAFQSASVYVEPGLDASSLVPSPFGMTPKAGVLLEIKAVRGAALDRLSQFDDEAELLLPRSGKYRVISIDRQMVETFIGEHDRWVVRLEQLP